MVDSASHILIQDIVSGARFMGICMMGYAVFRLVMVLRSTSLPRGYKVPGRLMVLACAVLGVQTLVQFMGHLRETNLALSWVINLVAYVVVVPAFDLAILYLLRGAKRLRLPVICSAVTAVLNVALLLCGLLYAGAAFSIIAPVMAALMLTVLEVLMLIWIEDDKRSMLRQRDGDPLIKRSATLCTCLLVAALGLPWVGLSPVLLVHAVYGMVMYYLMLSLVVCYCTHSIDMEVVSRRSLTAEAEAVAVEPQPTDKVVDDGIHRVEEVVKAWVESKEYTNPDTSIDKVLQAMGIPEKALYYYLECQEVPSFRSWISMLRIEEAKRQLLAHPNFSIDAIASLCGFSSGSSLSRAFRSVTGFSPSQWVSRQ